MTTHAPPTRAATDVARRRRVAELISHQLRTPLTVVRSGLAILDEPATSLSAAERQVVMSDVRQETERLVHVVDDLLAILTPAEEGHRDEPILVQRLIPAVLARGHRDVASIELDLDRDLPAVEGDPDPLGHLVRDLVVSAALADRARRVRVGARPRGPWLELVVRAGADAEPGTASDAEASALALHSARRVASSLGLRLVLRRARGYRVAVRLPVATER